MLIQFVVENFLSFRDKTVFSMLAPDHVKADGIYCIERGGLKLLRCAALYGANAAGKSNLFKALGFSKWLISHGVRPNDAIILSPFKLDEQTARLPTQIEFEILIDDRRYSYGFRLDAQAISQEWLYCTDTSGQEELLFERQAPEHEPNQLEFNFGNALQKTPERSQFIQFVAQGTRRNQLFLTEAGERNIHELRAIFDWFSLGLYPIFPDSLRGDLAGHIESNPELGSFVGKYLQYADTGITGITTKKFKASVFSGPLEIFIPGPALHLKTYHITGSGQNVEFNLDEESDGTQRLAHLAPILYKGAELSTRTYCIDEIDRSLHPLMTRRFISDFIQSEHMRSSQLIFTTHDTNLLSRKVLPLESIWFVEKNRQGASHLYPLSDFKREQLEQLGNSLEAGYLNGRFGAIPFFADRERLGWFNDGES